MEEEMILNHTHEETLYCAAIFRLVKAEHMARITGKSVDHFWHEMPKLARNGYLYRVTRDREITTEEYAAYMIDTKGISVVNRLYGIPKDKMRFKRKPIEHGQNDTWKWHTMMNATAMTAIYAETKDMFTPMLTVPRIEAPFWHNGELHNGSIKPDFGYTLEPYSYQPLVHYQETDTGSEPIERTDLSKDQRCLLGKILVYLAALQKGEEFCVTITTSTRERVWNIVETLRPAVAHMGGEEYADHFMIDDLETHLKDPLALWCNLKGEPMHLLGD